MNEDIPEGYTRVSSILSIFQAYAFVDRAKLKRAQEVGTDVHAAIKSYFEGSFEPLEFKKAPYMESFLKWANGREIEPLLVEKRLFDHRLMITGQVDLLAKIEGENVLVDFKTGSWAHPEIWRLQGSFYRALIEDHWLDDDGPEMPNRFLFIQLMKDGSDPILYDFKYHPSDLDVCLSAYRCYKYFSAPTEMRT